MVRPVQDAFGRYSAACERVGKVNVDEQPELAKRFGIASIPTVILFRNGEAVQRQMGVAPKAAFLNMLQEAK